MANEGNGKVVEQRCPECGQRPDPEQDSPTLSQPGTIAICWSCASPVIVSDDHTLRLTVPEDYDGRDPHAVVQFAQMRKRIARLVEARRVAS